MREWFYKFKWRHFHPLAESKFDELLRNERLSRDELEARQECARRHMVATAFCNTSFYNRYYSAVGFELGDIGSDSWFEKLPIVTKRELREHFGEFVNPALRHYLRISTTGGSTGTPTKTGYDGRIPEEVYSWRLQSRFGVHPWDDHAYVWRDRRPGRAAKMKNAVLWWPTRHLKLDATFMTNEGIASFLSQCRRVKPKLLQGYVGAIAQVSQYVSEHPASINGWVPKFVWTTSAPISLVQRELIEKVFNAPVCDEYGSCECRWIACQCQECKGLHVNVEHVNIEYVDDLNMPVPKGVYGRTLLTNLEDEVFPLIRYENNDRGRWLAESCSCGRTLPCIDSVKGRESESFILPSGKIVNGEYLTTIFDTTPDAVRAFRVVQHEDLSITIEYVPSSNSLANLNLITGVLKSFASSLRGEVAVQFRQVNEIPHDRGKLRFIVKEK